MMWRSAPSYSPADRATSTELGGRRRQAGHIARDGSRTRHEGSIPPHVRQKGGLRRRTLAQQRGQTGPLSGSSRTRAHAAHSGARTTASSAFAARRIASRVRLVGKFVPFGVPPESLESVERPALTAEDVYDEVEVVEQNPFRAVHAFGQRRPLIELGLEGLAYRIGDRVDLTSVVTSADHEVV